MRTVRAALVALACLGALSACGGDDVNTSTDPVEVEVGKVERSAGVDTVTTPEVKGSVTNTSDETRAAIFEMVFSADGEPVATLSCTAATMVSKQSQQFLCPGLAATRPEDYDAVVVQEFTRDATSG